jgi:pyruvate/2-oxoglutarate dehydrogenase complex dihydrolipoamide dehydrogenase (E3) component
MYQARIAVSDILGHDSREAVYRGMPRVTFTDPEIGATGLTEKQARDQGFSVRTGIMKVSTSARGWIHKAGNDGFIKLIADADRNVLVGATSAGPVGGEVLSMLTLAVHAEIPLSVLDSMIYAYPTFHRGVTDALRALLEEEMSLR